MCDGLRKWFAHLLTRNPDLDVSATSLLRRQVVRQKMYRRQIDDGLKRIARASPRMARPFADHDLLAARVRRPASATVAQEANRASAPRNWRRTGGAAYHFCFIERSPALPGGQTLITPGQAQGEQVLSQDTGRPP